MMKKFITTFIMILTAAQTCAAGEPHSHKSPYAGQESNAIKSLSREDIAELKRGGGWGLARAAELNGVPGPIHLLEMKKAISLTEAQITAIKNIYTQMKAKAITQGLNLIALEEELERHFQNRTITDTILRSSLKAISEAREKLRYIHLSAHLKTPEILSEAQIRKYNDLRGYNTDDLCQNIPKGHDAGMWRKHNGCE